MIKFLHASWAYFTLFALIFVIAQHSYNLFSGRKYRLQVEFRLALLGLIFFAVQVVLGIINFLYSDYFHALRNGSFPDVMKNAHSRLAAVEHPAMGIIGLLLILYGFRRMFYQIDRKKKYMSIILFYGLALLLVLLRIPWKDRL